MPTRSTRRITVVPEDGSTEARPPWRLDVAFGAGESGVFLIDRAECRIGREADEGVEVVVPDPNVSRVHAIVRRAADDEHLILIDAQSSNGLFVNGRRVEQAEVREGDVIGLGKSLIVVGRGMPPMREEADLGIVGTATVVATLRARVLRVAPTMLPVMIVGPTGTGKELVARALHERSGREGAFVAINCAALPGTLVEAVLFGHRKGAFTGATSDQDGAFVQANGGTLFLDELGELSLEAQPKLLRVLETMEVTPIGAVRPLTVNVRIVVATNVALDAAMAEKRFREDLYARLAGMVLRTPTLAERRCDVLPLFRSFLDPVFAARPMTTSFAESLLLYGWPHNVRELRRLAERLQVLHPDSPGWERSMLDEAMQRITTTPVSQAPPCAEPGAERAEGAEPPRGIAGPPSREELIELLARNDGNVSLVARQVGRNRKQVYRWMEQHGIEPGTGREDEDTQHTQDTQDTNKM